MKTDYEKARERAEEIRQEEERRRREEPLITITTSGHPSINLGGGLGIDLVTGGPTANFGGGITVDL